MDHEHKVDIMLPHPVDVSEATKYLLHQLDCDEWYVACHHEHLFVLHLTQAAVDRYAVRFECTSPVEKGIYHGSKAWSMSIIPLRGEDNLQEERVKEIRARLAELGSSKVCR
jgi:hypothetical protein